jgi:hypothetical protein
MAEEARRALTRALLALALALAALTTGAAGPQPRTKPAWAELTADQQQILDPLKAEWNALSSSRKKTWIGIANRYPSMNAQEQQRVQARMQKWAKLTPEQRHAARERYKSIGKLPPDKRETLRQQWAEYQALPPGEKRMLDAPPASAERRARKPRPTTTPPSNPPKSTPAPR